MLSEPKAVPTEAVAFLGAVLIFVLLLVIFFLYLNRSLCFSECGGFPCIDKVPQKENFLDDSDTEDRVRQSARVSCQMTSPDPEAAPQPGPHETADVVLVIPSEQTPETIHTIQRDDVTSGNSVRLSGSKEGGKIRTWHGDIDI